MTLAADPVSMHADVRCAHCGLPVARGLIEPDADHQFCCSGCRTVFHVIHSCRVDQYYAFLRRDRDAGLAESLPAKVTGKGYREFDDPAFLEMHAPLDEVHGTRVVDFYLEGVHCAACVWLVEKLPAICPGVLESRLNLGKALVRITWIEGKAELSGIARTLDSIGYPPHPARSSNARRVRTLDDRRQLVRIGVAGACAGNTMLLATALYAGLFAKMDAGYSVLFRYLSMAIGLVALLWPGMVFLRGAWAAIKTRTPHLDLPISLGLVAGAIAGTWNTLTGSGEIYFDSLSVLVFLLLVGRFLQHRQQGIADDAVELLFSLTPMSAHRVAEDGGVSDVPISALKVEDVVEVLAGESVPVDGVVVSGRTTVDESLLTGEALPKAAKAGSTVHAGTVNVSSPIRVTVHAAGEATRVGKLMRLVTECARRKAPMMLLADRIAGYFLAAVLVISAAVFGYWTLHKSPRAVDRAVAILIVACPCALGLATPLAVTVAIGRAARRGILIKGGDCLERLARPGMLLLDKTGTLTMGRIAMQAWEGDGSLKGAVLAIESRATHPIARAFCEALRKECDTPPSAADVVQDMHGGIRGTVDGREFLIGSPAFVTRRCNANSKWCENAVKGFVRRAMTPVLIAVDGDIRAAAGFGDTLRPDAAAALESLREAGWRLGILSGDHPQIVAHIAGELDIDASCAVGGLLPEEKLNHVRAALQQGPVVMVGDGVNDAAALAAATVGIAVHGGAEASLAAASIYLNEPGLSAVADTVRASRNTVRAIRRGLIASAGYNAAAIALAAVGWINPLVAAVLMPVSSLTVLTLAFGSRTFSRGRGVR
ncbi:MAG TPA: heavy metal translocating P-type ATPase [Phycisphaerae bacterium]|nr:heavy metal translocating P-type ATPase [Phycisphaerae bacterium]